MTDREPPAIRLAHKPVRSLPFFCDKTRGQRFERGMGTVEIDSPYANGMRRQRWKRCRQSFWKKI
jgi:hypothetical protein